MVAGTTVILDSLFTRNELNGEVTLGAGLSTSTCNMEIRRCTFEGNHAFVDASSQYGSQGGAVAVIYSQDPNTFVLFEDSVFGGNVVSSWVHTFMGGWLAGWLAGWQAGLLVG